MDTVNYIGAAASVIGLGISIWLITITQGARKAAQEARKLMYSKNLLSELRDIKQNVLQLQNEIDKGDKSLANYLIVRSIDQVNLFKSKWGQELEGRGNMSFMNEDLNSAAMYIVKINEAALDVRQKARLQIAAGKALIYINDELGHWERKLSGEN